MIPPRPAPQLLASGRPAGRRTGLAVLIALLVLLFAGALLAVLHEVFGGLSAGAALVSIVDRVSDFPAMGPG